MSYSLKPWHPGKAHLRLTGNMPILANPRHEAFCQAFVTSGNASAAYRESGAMGKMPTLWPIS
jgi:hypothetical protein